MTKSEERKIQIELINKQINLLESNKNDIFGEAIEENKIEYISYPPYGGVPQKQILDKFDLMFISIGHWDCENSPIGLCFYHDIEDEAHDNCLICNEPHERK